MNLGGKLHRIQVPPSPHWRKISLGALGLTLPTLKCLATELDMDIDLSILREKIDRSDTPIRIEPK